TAAKAQLEAQVLAAQDNEHAGNDPISDEREERNPFTGEEDVTAGPGEGELFDKTHKYKGVDTKKLEDIAGTLELFIVFESYFQSYSCY
uniref:Uncharacterized protein n=1 Tax=Aotus nancymaae TaxID=37293 RepID=A0A2K5ER40_AOTNA